MKLTLHLGRSDLDRYRAVFASIPEVVLSEGSIDLVEIDDHDHRVTMLPRLVVGADPNLAARTVAQTVPPDTIGVVAARFVPYQERDALELAGLSWCDGRGALHLSWPGTLVHIDRGGRRQVGQQIVGREEFRLGPSGIRAVQVLLEGTDSEWTVNRLAENARISVGHAHNVFRAMEQNRLVHAVGKGSKQRRVLDDRSAALDWLATVDGGRRRAPSTASYLYARTDQEVARRFAEMASEAGVTYAVTGAAGSHLRGFPVLSRIITTHIRVGMLQPADVLERLGIEPFGADEHGRGTNLELWSDVGELGSFAAESYDGIRVAPAIRVWLDMRRQGGRNQDAAHIFRDQALERI